MSRSPVFANTSPTNLRSALVCPTAFKGTLSPLQAAQAIARGIKSSFRSVTLLPLADGGDGTLEVLMSAFRGKRRRTRVTGPLGRPVVAEWGFVSGVRGLRGPTAVIEMARASGLALTRGKNRVMEATSRGTGELISAALDAGCRSILLGVGGTATADGGAGALAALGLGFLGRGKRPLATSPLSLLELASIDSSTLDPRLRRTKIIVLCDVSNPLLGPRGSARTFGPQKGASAAEVRVLERAMKHLSTFAHRQTKSFPGAGAAGATAFGLSAFAGAQLVNGCAFIMTAVGWRTLARRAQVLITGEGKLDRTSFSGKVAGEVSRCRRRATAVAICGSTNLKKTDLFRRGFSAVEMLGPDGLQHPARAVENAARRVAEKISGGLHAE